MSTWGLYTSRHVLFDENNFPFSYSSRLPASLLSTNTSVSLPLLFRSTYPLSQSSMATGKDNNSTFPQNDIDFVPKCY